MFRPAHWCNLTRLILSCHLSCRRLTTVQRADRFINRSMSASSELALDERWRQPTDNDWVASLDLSAAKSLIQLLSQSNNPPNKHVQPRVLILYGSLRATSYSRLLAFEFARILDSLGAEVRVFNPQDCTDERRGD